MMVKVNLKWSIFWLLAWVATLGGCASLGGSAGKQASTEGLMRAVAVLEMHARDGDSKIRANCIEALQPVKSDRVEGVVEQGLHDGTDIVRFTAAMTAGRRQSKELQGTLTRMLSTDPSDSVRAACVYALQRMGDDRGMVLLPAMLDSPNAATRANAALVLGIIGEKSAAGLLADHIKEPNADVRFSIIEALARLDVSAGVNALVALSLSKELDDHPRALAAFGNMNSQVGVNVLLSGLNDPVVENQLVAARGLGRNGITDGKDVAEKYLHDKEPQVRVLAVLALGDILPFKEQGTIAAMMADPDLNVQVAAAAATVNLYGRAAELGR